MSEVPHLNLLPFSPFCKTGEREEASPVSFRPPRELRVPGVGRAGPGAGGEGAAWHAALCPGQPPTHPRKRGRFLGRLRGFGSARWRPSACSPWPLLEAPRRARPQPRVLSQHRPRMLENSRGPLRRLGKAGADYRGRGNRWMLSWAPLPFPPPPSLPFFPGSPLALLPPKRKAFALGRRLWEPLPSISQKG